MGSLPIHNCCRSRCRLIFQVTFRLSDLCVQGLDVAVELLVDDNELENLWVFLSCGTPIAGIGNLFFQFRRQERTAVLGFLALPFQVLEGHLVDDGLFALRDDFGISGNAGSLEVVDAEDLGGSNGL
jgi:hypothetical protein